MPSKLVLSRQDYIQIEGEIKLQGDEDYAVVTHKGKGEWFRSIHVFQRHPNQKELQTYEHTASRVKLKGNKAELEGQKLLAAKDLYNLLINRVYDLPVGRKIYGNADNGEPPLDREAAMRLVEPLVKRAAILDMVSEVYSASQIEEREGVDEESPGSAKEDD
jgi:hypothetical protein